MRLSKNEIRYLEIKKNLEEGIKAFCPNCGYKIRVEPKVKGKIGGAIGGVISGAYLGSSIGLAGGPLGAIAGTIPGAILGGIFGNSVGRNFDNPSCYKCGTKFKIPSKLIDEYNSLISEFEELSKDEFNRYAKKH